MYFLKILLIFSILFVFLGFYFDNAEAQKNDIHQVILQLQLQNSEGQLVSYIEATQIISINPFLLNQYLDTKQSQIIKKDNQNFELIHWQGQTEKIYNFHAMSRFDLWVPRANDFVSSLSILHNSYQVEPGDTITVYWTIIRSI